MLKGHGALKAILGKSVVSSKRRRSPEEEASKPDIGSLPPIISQEISLGACSDSEPLGSDGEAKEHRPRCPVCGRCLLSNADPEYHVGKLPQLDLLDDAMHCTLLRLENPSACCAPVLRLQATCLSGAP
jgi:hypothetical protein